MTQRRRSASSAFAGQNKGQTIRVIGARRVVLAFARHPTTATCCPPSSSSCASARWPRPRAATSRGWRPLRSRSPQRWVCSTRSTRSPPVSGSIRKSAEAIDTECPTVQTGVAAHLGRALDATAGVAMEAATWPPTTPPRPGAPVALPDRRRAGRHGGEAVGPLQPLQRGVPRATRPKETLMNRKHIGLGGPRPSSPWPPERRERGPERGRRHLFYRSPRQPAPPQPHGTGPVHRGRRTRWPWQRR